MQRSPATRYAAADQAINRLFDVASGITTGDSSRHQRLDALSGWAPR